MRRRTKIVIATAAVGLGVAVAGGGTAVAVGTSDTEQPITGPDLAAATTAALQQTGGGRVTETEAGDEEGAYEVEVTLPDGRQVDVHLDRDFAVLSTVADGDEAADSDDGAGAPAGGS